MHTLVLYYWITHHQESVSICWLLENIHYSHNIQALNFCINDRDLGSIYYSNSSIPSNLNPVQGYKPVLNVLRSYNKEDKSLVYSVVVNSTNNGYFSPKSSSSPLDRSHNDESYLEE